MKTQNNNNTSEKDERNYSDVRPVEPAIKEPAPPLSRTQHIISGVAIILAIIILSVFAVAVTNWHKQQNSVQNNTSSNSAATTQEETSASASRESEAKAIRGNLEAVLPTSLARGNSIEVGIDDQIIVINPIYSSGDGEKDLVSLLFDSLISINDEGRPMPELASSWQYNQEDGELTFTIAPGHFFRDGRAVDVDDVIFTYNCLIADSYNGPYKGRFSEITNIGPGTSEDSVIFTFSDRFVEPDFNLFTIGIMKKDHYIDSVDHVYKMYDNRISPEGSGAFKLEEYTEDNAVVSLREGYAGNIESITFQRIPSDDKFSLLQNGQLDIVRSRWDDRMKIRSKSLDAYSFYPSDSKIEAYVMTGRNFSADSTLATLDHRYAALLKLADFELNDAQAKLLDSITKPINCYYFKGVDEQVNELNLKMVKELERKLDPFPLEIEPLGLDWPEMAYKLENDQDYDLLLLPAPSNNRLPQGTILLTRTHSLNAIENANAWPAFTSNEALIINSRLLQIDIAKNAFPLSAATAGWTKRLENIRFYDPSDNGGTDYEEDRIPE